MYLFIYLCIYLFIYRNCIHICLELWFDLYFWMVFHPPKQGGFSSRCIIYIFRIRWQPLKTYPIPIKKLKDTPWQHKKTTWRSKLIRFFIASPEPRSVWCCHRHSLGVWPVTTVLGLRPPEVFFLESRHFAPTRMLRVRRPKKNRTFHLEVQIGNWTFLESSPQKLRLLTASKFNLTVSLESYPPQKKKLEGSEDDWFSFSFLFGKVLIHPLPRSRQP